MDYLITIHGPYFDYVYIRDYGICYFDWDLFGQGLIRDLGKAIRFGDFDL